MKMTLEKAPRISIRLKPKFIFLVALRVLKYVEIRLITKPPRSDSKWKPSHMIASELAKKPPTSSRHMNITHRMMMITSLRITERCTCSEISVFSLLLLLLLLLWLERISQELSRCMLIWRVEAALITLRLDR